MDIIRDFLDRVSSAIGSETFTDQIAINIEQQMRKDWGGDRPYIPKSSDADMTVVTRRDVAVRRDYRSGESVSLIARRFGISRAMVYKIVSG